MHMNSMFQRLSQLRPFLKWVGGKSQLRNEIASRLIPDCYEDSVRYYEPFAGGAAIFFELMRHGALKGAVLNDLNYDLIATYETIRDDLPALIDALKEWTDARNQSPEKHFYEVRALEPENKILRAARMIYLNKTCFNGLYRVNQQGKFNSPWNHNPQSRILDAENLKAVHHALQGVRLSCATWQEAIADVTSNDIVYFDPPYVPMNADSFTSYTNHPFGWEQQIELRDKALELKSKGVRLMISNSSSPLVYDLFSDFQITEVKATRRINCKAQGRTAIEEVLIV